MTSGLYLYCLKETGETRSPIEAAGVDGKGEIFMVAVGGVDAVVSRVDTDDFGAMQAKAREDIHWIKEKALAHEIVVEEAMGLSSAIARRRTSCADANAGTSLGLSRRDHTAHGTADGYRIWQSGLMPVIPVKFGVIFNDAKRIEEVIDKQIAAIKAAFDRIRGKQEWSIKLFLKDNQDFKDRVREQSEPLRRKSKELAALPAGKAYFMEAEFNEELERECSRLLDEEAAKLFDALKPFAAEVTRVKILDDKLTGRNDRMVFNSACLVEDGHLLKLEHAIAIMRDKLAEAGLLLEMSGPWPAYHFAEFTNERHL
jgi:hypothetical protein